MSKKVLSFEEIEGQAALELPERNMLALVNVVIFDVLNNNTVVVQLPIGIAANVCGIQANVLAAAVRQDQDFECVARSNQTLQALPRGHQG